MKTLFKTYTNLYKCIEKRKHFEAKTGVAWNFHSTGDGVRFGPIVTLQTPVNDKSAKRLMPFLTTNYQGFIELLKISNMELPDILIAAKTLVKENRAMMGTNRIGNFAAIRVKTRYELIRETLRR